MPDRFQISEGEGFTDDAGLLRNDDGSISHVGADGTETLVVNADGTLAGNGGPQTFKHEVIPIAFTDIDTATGLADLYLLPENETIFASWFVVTATFDGADVSEFAFGSAQAYGPSGAAGSGQLSDTFDCTQSSIDNAIDGLMGPDPADGAGSNTTLPMIPIVQPVPGGGSVQTVIDFANGNVPVTQGTQGQLDAHLLIAVSP